MKNLSLKLVLFLSISLFLTSCQNVFVWTLNDIFLLLIIGVVIYLFFIFKLHKKTKK